MQSHQNPCSGFDEGHVRHFRGKCGTEFLRDDYVSTAWYREAGRCCSHNAYPVGHRASLPVLGPSALHQSVDLKPDKRTRCVHASRSMDKRFSSVWSVALGRV